ncbi:hypothetical protein MMPV_008208 [Pyropia vietnamensis]
MEDAFRLLSSGSRYRRPPPPRAATPTAKRQRPLPSSTGGAPPPPPPQSIQAAVAHLARLATPLSAAAFTTAAAARKAAGVRLDKHAGPTTPAPLFHPPDLAAAAGAPALAPALATAFGITAATAVQAQGIPLMLAGREVLAVAPTGSGKTLAYGVPLLVRAALAEGGRGVTGVVLAPTRELVEQIGDVLTRAIGAMRAEVDKGEGRVASPSGVIAMGMASVRVVCLLSTGGDGRGAARWRRPRKRRGGGKPPARDKPPPQGVPAAASDDSDDEEDDTAVRTAERRVLTSAAAPATVVVATPARLAVAGGWGVDWTGVRDVVLDEADKLFEERFVAQLDAALAVVGGAGGATVGEGVGCYWRGRVKTRRHRKGTAAPVERGLSAGGGGRAPPRRRTTGGSGGAVAPFADGSGSDSSGGDDSSSHSDSDDSCSHGDSDDNNGHSADSDDGSSHSDSDESNSGSGGDDSGSTSSDAPAVDDSGGDSSGDAAALTVAATAAAGATATVTTATGAPPPIRYHLFSATLPPPVEAAARTLARVPAKLSVGSDAYGGGGVASVDATTATRITQRFLFAGGRGDAGKLLALRSLLASGGLAPPALVFVETQDRATAVLAELISAAAECPATSRLTMDVLHGGRPQVERSEAVRRYRTGEVSVLVATDVLGRGLDCPATRTVLSFDAPSSPVTYVHRIGRTGRSGGVAGTAITLFTEADGPGLGRLVTVATAGGAVIPDWMRALGGGGGGIPCTRAYYSPRVAAESDGGAPPAVAAAGCGG